jgi:serine/threonine protein kinase
MIGESFGHYRISRELGRGGMGVVYAAHDTRLDRDVAIEVLPPELDSPAAMNRLVREARAASALNHPNICTVYDIDERAGQPFIVMELIPGESMTCRCRWWTSAAPTSRRQRSAAPSATNLPNFRLRAGVVQTPAGPYFIKLTGPARTVAAQAQAFDRFVASLSR